MAVELHSEDKHLRVSVLDYQFPFDEKMDSYDANWLYLKLEYCENGKVSAYKDPCLLSWELEWIVKDFDDIIHGKTQSVDREDDYIEPNLQMFIKNINETYTVLFRYIYDLRDEDECNVFVEQEMSKEEFCRLRDSFAELCAQFPPRKVLEG